jgi:hypothetical protein
MRSRLSLFLTCSFLVLSSYILPASSDSPDYKKGYRCIVPIKDMFLACNQNGKIDWINNEGSVLRSENGFRDTINSLMTDGDNIMAACNRGFVLLSSDGKTFQKIHVGTDKNILCLERFKDKILAGCEGGELLVGDWNGTFSKFQLNLKGSILSLSARTSDCFGVTDDGEIIRSTDGINWTTFNFNDVYYGYYKTCSFSKVLAMEDRISVIGQKSDGLPVLMFSSEGQVWTERTLNFTDENGVYGMLEDLANDLLYDYNEDQLLLVCNKGRMVSIPSCSHCNKLYVLSDENLNGMAGNENTLMVVGDNDFIQAMRVIR